MEAVCIADASGNHDVVGPRGQCPILLLRDMRFLRGHLVWSTHQSMQVLCLHPISAGSIDLVMEVQEEAAGLFMAG